MQTNRRQFLNYLLGSPLVAATGMASAQEPWLYRMLESITDLDPGLPDSMASVAGVFELEELAEKVLPPAHFGYIYSGAGNGESKQANRDAYARYDIQPRRLQGIGEVDLSTEIFGEQWNSPIFLSPTNGHMAFHPEGEIASARGASQAGVTQMLSSLTTTPIEAVNAAKTDKPVWFQLYPTNSEEIRYQLVQRVEAAGCPAIVVTIDDIGGRGSEISAAYYNRDDRDCGVCHQRQLGTPDFLKRKMMFLEYKDLPGFDITDAAINFDDIRRLRDQVKGKLFVKGIMHPEDALGCLEAGADGIVVSNHGGRVDSGGVGTLDVLPAITQVVQGRMKIFLDGGIRRGTDAFKALALGADAVGFGRPYLWGLAAFGSEGVALSVQLIENELRRAMVQSASKSVAEISADKLA
jgi:isopentenyl diphosphate isomerase/L-lactate dehydrogenase-like FMN-dependent dehydrogenase